MFILKQLTGDEEYYPTVSIGRTEFIECEMLDVDIYLKEAPSEAKLDQLRLALKKWAEECGFGELAQER